MGGNSFLTGDTTPEVVIDSTEVAIARNFDTINIIGPITTVDKAPTVDLSNITVDNTEIMEQLEIITALT